MKHIIVALLFLTSNIVLAQTADALFDNANTLYKEGKYQEAIKLYQQIEESKEVSSELYFNLGNAYYKLNKVAPSIYNYERALLLDPLNEDAQNNLIIANRLTLDRIEALPTSIFQKINNNLLKKLTYNSWAILTIIASIIASILFLLFYFSNIPSKKRLFFSTSIVAFLLLIFTVVITFTQYSQYKNTVTAIIFAEQATIKNAPTNDASEVFTLHEGTKVNVLDTVDDWKKIKLIDGKIGWLKNNQLKAL